MKTTIQKLWMIIAVLWSSISAISASAYDFEVDGIRYDITSFTDLTVTASSISENTEGSINIPSSVEFSGKTLTVMAIGDRFIEGNQKIMSLVISDGVIEIGSFAFNNCSNLSDVSIPESVIAIKSNAFAKCTNIKSIKANGTETIGDNCFEGCTSIESVSFSKTENIPVNAFSGCSKLTLAEFPSAQCIGSNAFTGCAFSLFDVPSSVNEIKSYAFSNCKQLESFIIPNNVKTIGPGLLNGCSSLKEVTIGSGITNLPWIFDNCSNLEKLRIEDSHSTLTFEYSGSRDFHDSTGVNSSKNLSSEYTPAVSMFANTTIKEVYIGRNLTTEVFAYKRIEGANETRTYYYIPNPPFSSSGITKLEIGPLVTDYDMCQSKSTDLSHNVYVNGSWYGAFQNCVNLQEIKIRSSASLISKNSFAGCSSLKSVMIPNTVKVIESGAFQNCVALESIDLGCYLTSLGNNVFTGDLMLSSINLRSLTPPSYSTGFSSTEYINTAVNIPKGCIDNYKSAEPWKNFWNLSESEDLISLFEVDEINYLVSSENNVQVVGETISSLRKVLIPSTVLYSGIQFFVSSIGDNAFKNCMKIEELEIGKGVANIGNNSFEGCGNLKNVCLPSSINTIGVGAFKNCKNLKICNLATPIEVIPEECFYGCNSLSNYSFDGVTEIGNSSFYGCNSLSKIIISPTIASIGFFAFSACSNIKELIIEDSNVEIDFPEGSYGGITPLQKKEVNGRTIQFKILFYNPFFDGLPIENLYIGRNLSDSPRHTIGFNDDEDYYLIVSCDAPFSKLPKLKELTIGEGVDILGPLDCFIQELGMEVSPGSFKYCNSLEKVSVKSATPPRGAEFSNTAYSNAKLIVPDNTISLYQSAEGWKEFLDIIGNSSSGIESGIEDVYNNKKESIISTNSEGLIYTGESKEYIYIYGIDGKLLYSGDVEPNQSISLANGFYILRIKNDSIKIKI